MNLIMHGKISKVTTKRLNIDICTFEACRSKT